MSGFDSDASDRAKAFGQGDPRVAAYALEVFRPEDEILREVRARSRAAGLPEIQVGPMDGLHLEVLARLLRPRRAVEIGSLGGYSAICLLRGMPQDGRLWALELAPERTKLVEEHAALAGFAGRVRAIPGPAIESLRSIESEGPFDLVFIDADKGGYPAYLDWAAEHLRVGGAAIGDNTFAWGLVGSLADPDNQASERDMKQARALDEFNRKASGGGRFRATVLPTAEGLTVAIKTHW